MNCVTLCENGSSRQQPIIKLNGLSVQVAHRHQDSSISVFWTYVKKCRSDSGSVELTLRNLLASTCRHPS